MNTHTYGPEVCLACFSMLDKSPATLRHETIFGTGDAAFRAVGFAHARCLVRQGHQRCARDVNRMAHRSDLTQHPH